MTFDVDRDALGALWTSLTRPSWHEHAACRGLGHDLFFPTRGEDTRPARAVCDGCPVRGECRDAGSREQFGIWGGTSERHRKLARRRNRTDRDERSAA